MWKLRRGFLLTTVTLLAGCSSAQTGLRLGDRVRITPSDPAEERFTGSYEDSRDEGLVVLGGDGPITIPTSLISTLERQDGTRGRGGPGAGIGLLVGGAIGVAVAKDCEGEHGLQGICQIASIGIGVLGGPLLGALVGSFVRTENWVMVPLVEVAPSGGIGTARGVSFGLRFARSRWTR